MNIILRALFLSCLIVTLVGPFVWGGQIQMKFKKGMWSNTYYLIVDNTATERAIEFQGGWEEYGAKTNYYVVTSDKNRYYFSSPKFKEIGVKGRLWIPPGESVKIPFRIPDSIIKNAHDIVFEGFSFVLTNNNGVTDQGEYRDLTITYEVGKGIFKVEIGDALIKSDDTHFNKNNDYHVVSDEKSRLSVDSIIPADSFKAIDVDNLGKP